MDPARERLDRGLAMEERGRADEDAVGRLAVEESAPIGVDRCVAGEGAGTIEIDVAHRSELDAVEPPQDRRVLLGDPAGADDRRAHGSDVIAPH